MNADPGPTVQSAWESPVDVTSYELFLLLVVAVVFVWSGISPYGSFHSSGAEAFLGTQCDPWDTQWDIMLALIGAVTALVLLSRWHDRQLAAPSR